MTVNLDDREELLFRLFKMGDQLAFERIFKANYNRIAGFCAQFIGEREYVPEIAQEAFVNLWLNREKIHTSNGIKAFLYTFAKTNCLNYIRHRKVMEKYHNRQLREKEELFNEEVLTSFDFGSLEFSELEQLIFESVNEMPEKCRVVFIKSRYEGKKNIEIAREMDITEKAVEADLTRALRTLKTKLSGYLPVSVLHLVIQHIS